MTGWHDAIIGNDLRRNHQGVTIHTSDAFLNVEIVKIVPHVLLMTVDAHIICLSEQRTLAVGIVTVHTAYIRVGAGIVHDSVPKTEFEETDHKAGSCMRALQEK